jgi:hypothetical protein
MQRGESEILFDVEVEALVCRDKKPIYFVLTVFISSPNERVLRYDAVEHRCVPVDAPKVVKSYNDYMGCTDKNDQMIRLKNVVDITDGLEGLC